MIAYTTDAILQKYNIENYTPKGTQKFITFMRMRGVELELAEAARGRAKSTYYILSDELSNPDEIWKPHPIYSDWYFSNLGNVKNIKTNKYYGKGIKTAEGYYSIPVNENTRLKVHRGVMMAFNPIDMADQYVVDHINGQRGDNQLQNLRWVWQTDNAKFANVNNTSVKELVGQLIQQRGYENTIEFLKTGLQPKA